MVADENGVVAVPTNLMQQVVELALKGREIDEKCLEDIKSGRGIRATFKKHRGS